MKKQITILLLLCFLSLISFSQSQTYKNAIGLCGGWKSGITAKHFFSEGKAVELILSNGSFGHGVQLTGLYELHKPAFKKNDVEGMFWLYGLGGHFGGGYSYSYLYFDSKNLPYYRQYNYVAIGLDLIFGLEYNIPDIPFTVGANIKPYFEFGTQAGIPFSFFDASLAVRYILN